MLDFFAVIFSRQGIIIFWINAEKVMAIIYYLF